MGKNKIDVFELHEANKTPHERLAIADFNIMKHAMKNSKYSDVDYDAIIRYAQFAKRAIWELDNEIEEMAQYFEQEQAYGN